MFKNCLKNRIFDPKNRIYYVYWVPEITRVIPLGYPGSKMGRVYPITRVSYTSGRKQKKLGSLMTPPAIFISFLCDNFFKMWFLKKKIKTSSSNPSSSSHGCLHNMIYLLPLKSAVGLAALQWFRESVSKLSKKNSDLILIWSSL